MGRMEPRVYLVTCAIGAEMDDKNMGFEERKKEDLI